MHRSRCREAITRSEHNPVILVLSACARHCAFGTLHWLAAQIMWAARSRELMERRLLPAHRAVGHPPSPRREDLRSTCGLEPSLPGGRCSACASPVGPVAWPTDTPHCARARGRHLAVRGCWRSADARLTSGGRFGCNAGRGRALHRAGVSTALPSSAIAGAACSASTPCTIAVKCAALCT